MNDFSFLSPTRLIVGKSAEAQVGQWVRQYGGTRVLVHYGGGHVKQCGLLDTVIGSLKEVGAVVFELGGVVPNPNLSLVREGIELCRREKINFLLAVGGGSVIDSCKAIGMGVPYDGDVWDFFAENDGIPLAVPQARIPVGVVLTIAAAGSEASNSCVITKSDEQLKRFCDNDINRPVFAIENPELTMSLPPYQTACGIVDVMSHSMERYFTPEKTNDVLTDHLCEAIFRTCMDCARTLMADPHSYEARASMMVASSLSHNGLTSMGRTGDWASHFIEHELSGEYNVTHGAGLAVITPAWMKYVYPECRTLFLKWATRVMGVSQDYDDADWTILEAIRRLEDFYRFLGMPVRLHEIQGVGEIREETMYKMARRVRKVHPDGAVGWVKRLYTEDIVKILRLAK